MVLDAAALFDLVLPTTAYRSIAPILQQTPELHIPALCDIEVASALRQALLSRAITEAHAMEAVRDYLDLPLIRHGHGELMDRILELRNNFSAYDAAYVALAEMLEAPLLTTDAKLTRALRDHVSPQLLAPLEK